MIKLKNIKIDKGIAECDVFLEDCKECGNIKVNLSENKIIECTLPTGYEWCQNHMQHAKKYLSNLNDLADEHPNEKILMWY